MSLGVIIYFNIGALGMVFGNLDTISTFDVVLRTSLCACKADTYSIRVEFCLIYMVWYCQGIIDLIGVPNLLLISV